MSSHQHPNAPFTSPQLSTCLKFAYDTSKPAPERETALFIALDSLTHVFSKHDDKVNKTLLLTEIELAIDYYTTSLSNEVAKDSPSSSSSSHNVLKHAITVARILSSQALLVLRFESNMVKDRAMKCAGKACLIVAVMSSRGNNLHGEMKWKYKAEECFRHFTRQFSETELDILRQSSVVNGMIFLPFDEHIDKIHRTRRSSFRGKKLFHDEDLAPVPALSTMQAKMLSQWSRGTAASTTVLVSPAWSIREIRQGFVPNCSFISSLDVLVQLENRKMAFGKFTWHCLYPHDRSSVLRMKWKNNRHKQAPCIPRNPHGRYVARLWWNGAPRRVEIDDILPYDSDGQLLTAHTSLNELWVPLLEKAYLKLIAGGYANFTGSNSGIDVYALTGWPPETLRFNDAHDANKAWLGLVRGLAIGDNVVTATSIGGTATCYVGRDREILIDKAELEPFHAYSVLSTLEINGVRYLQMRNPWGRGPHNGIFWIDIREASKCFGAFYVNWNLALFPCVSLYHYEAMSKRVFTKQQHDLLLLDLGNTIQLRVASTGLIWVVVSRHITDASKLQGSEVDALAIHSFLPLGSVDVSLDRIFWHDTNERPMISKGDYVTNPHTVSMFEPGEFVVVVDTYINTEHENSPCTVTVYGTQMISVIEIPRHGMGRVAVKANIENVDDMWVMSNPALSPTTTTAAALRIVASLTTQQGGIAVFAANLQEKHSKLLCTKAGSRLCIVMEENEEAWLKSQFDVLVIVPFFKDLETDGGIGEIMKWRSSSSSLSGTGSSSASIISKQELGELELEFDETWLLNRVDEHAHRRKIRKLLKACTR